jgi:hypothetical protein
MFLLRRSDAGPAVGSFEREYIRRFTFACGYILDGDILRGVRMVRGLGPGLTPAGDDFISGIFLALNILAGCGQSGLKEIIDAAYQEARSANPFTNAFLRWSANGWMNEKCGRLVESLFLRESTQIAAAVRRMLTMGATSGADYGTGLLVGFKGYCE